MTANSYIFGLTMAFAAALPAGAAVLNIGFDEADYKSVGVYDTWSQSPFRTGALEGNAAVVDNHLKDDDTNPSLKILGVQRSRFGSNTFGVRIDLKEPFELIPTQRYAHVMINRPVEGRVMLIGLGCRADRPGQSPEVEQFWSFPVNSVGADGWYDAVFPINGNGGIDIHSLVVVPYCEASHRLQSDFVAYIDNIEITDSPAPRFGGGSYPINFDESAKVTRTDRYIKSVRLSGSDNGVTSVSLPATNPMHYNRLFESRFSAKPGQTLTPSFDYLGSWMHGYLYLDRDNDGQFSAAVDGNNNLDRSTDLMSFSWIMISETGSGKNSAGTVISTSGGAHNTMSMPSFTVPADLAPGIYRLRYKVDWNSIDPGGSITPGNTLVANGGGIVDVLLNVHGDLCSVVNDNRNGEVTLADGTSLDGYRTPYRQPLTVKMVPSNGFTHNGIRLRHGYNLTGDSILHGNPQHSDVFFGADRFSADNTFTIPAEYVDGDLLIEGLFVEEKGTHVAVTYEYYCGGSKVGESVARVSPGDEWPQPKFDCGTSPAYYELNGLPEGRVGDSDEVVRIDIVENTPFKSTSGFDYMYCYNLKLTADGNYLSYNPDLSYISLDASTVSKPSLDDVSALWAFVGNVVDGFMIMNCGAGNDMPLASSTVTSANTGGSTFPVPTAMPIPEGYECRWFPTVSESIAGEQGFYLHQKGHPENRMNSRDSRLAFWTGGADAGSTFRCEFVDHAVGMDAVAADNAASVFYNLQGVKLGADRPSVSGVYIERRGSAASKVLVR